MDTHFMGNQGSVLTRRDLNDWRVLLLKIAGEAAGLLKDNACRPEYAAKVGGESIRADVESESYIIDALKAEGFRGVVVSEEAGTVVLGDDDYIVLVDPLDGSSNYSTCISWASVSLALVKRGATLRSGLLAGVVQPIFYGPPISFARGLGCFLGGTRVERPTQQSRMMYVYMESRDALEAVAKAFQELGRPKVRSLGSAALEMTYAAIGRGLVFIDIRSRLRNVDIAAAYGITLECGGEVLKPGGKVLDVGVAKVEPVGSVISSGNREIAAKVAWLLKGVEAP
jgi:myo-inositol-1(or 4)-monophosphatase